MKIYTLENNFIRAEFLSFGATILSLTIKPLKRNVVLTNANIADYQKRDATYYGATVGPVAGRIKDGRYKIDGKIVNLDKNERNANTLHGGPFGFSFQDFSVEAQTKTQIIFTYHHHEKSDKFNGEYEVKVTYTLEENGLSVEYLVLPSEATIINMTNHSYFNLDGNGNILDHEIKAQTTGYFEFDEALIHTKFIQFTPSDVLNLSEGKILRDVVFDPSIYKLPSQGIDHLYTLHDGRVYLKTNDLSLEVVTNYSAVQLYTTNFPSPYPLKDYGKVNIHRAIAIEPVDALYGKDAVYAELEREKNTPYKRKINYIFKLL